MVPEADARSAALLALIQDPRQRGLAAWLILGFEALEHSDYGDLEPLSVYTPVRDE